jgi:hypothetical protein
MRRLIAAPVVLVGCLLASSCTGGPDVPARVPPSGPTIGDHPTACKGYLERVDIQGLLGDPANFIQSANIFGSTTNTCRLYDPAAHRYVLQFNVTDSRSILDLQMREGQARPGAVIQSDNAAAFPDPDGSSARALVRLPRRYVVVFLRQGPITADRLSRILVIANKIAATVPAPFGTAEPPHPQPHPHRLTGQPSGHIAASGPPWKLRRVRGMGGIAHSMYRYHAGRTGPAGLLWCWGAGQAITGGRRRWPQPGR